MAAKRIRVSVDNGTTWRTLPGSTGEKRTEMQAVNDTIFGQDWQSENPSIGQIQITANGFFKGVAGYSATIKKGGTPTAMTGEAMALVSGKTYQITSAIKRVLDLGAAITVLDGATNVTAQVQSIDYLNGMVTFKSTYTVVGAITMNGSYVPLATLAKARGFSVTQTAAEIDTTTLEVAQTNGGFRTFDPGLRTVGLEVQGIYDATSDFITALNSRSTLYIDISPNGNANTMFRGFFKPTGHQQAGDVGALETATMNMTLFVPNTDVLQAPFRWYFNTSPLSQALQDVLNAWQNGTKIDVQYLPNGTDGTAHDAIITECSLSDNFDGQNEFRFTFRVDGGSTPVTGAV